MLLNTKIKNAIENDPGVILLLQKNKQFSDWKNFTRTHFNNIATLINKEISKEVIKNPDLVAHFLIIGKLKIEKEIYSLRKKNSSDFVHYLNSFSQYQVYSWISGKTLQSYWNNGEAKAVKINALLVFLQVPFADWDSWMQGDAGSKMRPASAALPAMLYELNKHSFAIVKKYYTGNYYLYYQKTDGSKNIIKTPFVLKEHESGQIILQSVSEGHRYTGKVMGLRDGCLYINCQNLDFEEMEQYVFNIGLETKPEVLFGVSTTVSVKDRLAVALKNILVKQNNNDANFENIHEIEIPFSKKYTAVSEESLIVQFLIKSEHNVITTQSCCDLSDMEFYAK